MNPQYFNKSKRLLVLLESPCVYDGRIYGTKRSLYVFIKGLLPFFKKIVICAPTKRINEPITSQDYIILEEPKIKVVRLPYWDNFIDFFKEFYKIFPVLLKVVSPLIRTNDLLWLRLPSLSGLFFFICAKIYHKPAVIDIGGNIRKAWQRTRYRGIQKVLAKILSLLLHRVTNFMVSSALTIVTGEELYKLYKPKAKKIKVFVRSSLKRKDLTYREDTCKDKIIRLLYVGEILIDKGIIYLLDAVRKLREKNYPVELMIVGSGSDTNKIKEKIESSGISKAVKFKGYVPFGDSLFNIYRSADILVFPSIYFTEGIPRVIIEAFAFSLPVITTDIGGVKSIVINEKTGLLIKPHSSEEIYQAVRRLINDTYLRERMIKKSYEFAVAHTLEGEIKKITEEILSFYF